MTKVKEQNRIYIRFFGIMISCLLLLCSFSLAEGAGSDLPASEPVEFIEEAEFDYSLTEGLPSNDELAAGYINQMMFPGKTTIKKAPKPKGQNLTGGERKLYSLLKENVIKVAGAAIQSTQWYLCDYEDLYSKISFTASDLGLDSVISDTQAAMQAAVNLLNEEVSINKVFSTLMADCPYELYWYDKTKGYSCSPLYFSIDEETITVTGELTIGMPVSQNYALGEEEFTVDPKYGQGVTAAAANAQAIVSQHEGKNNYDRLEAYKDAICGLVSYNDEAAGNANTPYGDPWQLIWVFDRNLTTNVVCEGYAKAFKYLNDLSSGRATVICAEGDMAVNGEGGPHMWNIVSIDGRNYLVDVTNCDSGFDLFMVGYESGSVADGYIILANGTRILYTYRSGQVYSDQELTLSNISYRAYMNGHQELTLTVAPETALAGELILVQGTAPGAERIELRFYCMGNEEYSYARSEEADFFEEEFSFDPAGSWVVRMTASYQDGTILTTETAFTVIPTLDEADFSLSSDAVLRGEPFIVTIGLQQGYDETYSARVVRVQDGEATPYYSMDPDTYEITIPTWELREGEYDLEVLAEAEGMAGSCAHQTVTVLAGEQGTVVLELDKDELYPGEETAWRVYAPGAVRIRVKAWVEANDPWPEQIIWESDNTGAEDACILLGENDFGSDENTVYFQATAEYADGSTAQSEILPVDVSYLYMPDSQAVSWGSFGSNLTFRLYGDGALVITGNGPMGDGMQNPLASRIRKLIVGWGVTTIGSGVFSECTLLTDVSLPGSVTEIHADAFAGCTGLTSIRIPEGTTTIEDAAFSGCTNLTNVILPGSIRNLNGNAFENCYNLRTVYIPGYAVDVLAADSFRSLQTIEEIIIIESDDYYSVDGVVYYSGQYGQELILCPTGKTGVFQIPDGIVSISDMAFSGCGGLTDIILPDSLTAIGAYAFRNCSGLTDVTIPGGVTYIAEGTFEGCSALSRVDLPEMVTEIDAGAFRNCAGLTNMVFPEGMTRIGNGAFSGCGQLNDIRIPEGVTSIEDETFRNCTGLTSIYLPAGLTEIGYRAFDGCGLLADVYFEGSEEDWSNIAIDGGNDPLAYAVIQYNCHEHSWSEVEYEWSENLSEVTATRFCEVGTGHEETETVEVTSFVSLEPTCTEMGETTYVSNPFENEAFEVQSRKETDIPELGHSPVTDDAVEATCTETGLTEGSHCEVCGEILEPQEIIPKTPHIPVVDEPGVAATCTEPGYTDTVICEICGEVLVPAEEIPALGHDWDKPVYEWAEDYSTVTARRFCKRDPEHADDEEEEAETVMRILSPTEDEEGSIIYSAVFANEVYGTASKEVAIPALKDMQLLKLPDQLESIEEEAFAGGAFEAVVVPDGCLTIESRAFAGCTHLRYIRIPGDTDVAADAFAGCDNVIVDYGN